MSQFFDKSEPRPAASWTAAQLDQAIAALGRSPLQAMAEIPGNHNRVCVWIQGSRSEATTTPYTGTVDLEVGTFSPYETRAIVYGNLRSEPVDTADCTSRVLSVPPGSFLRLTFHDLEKGADPFSPAPSIYALRVWVQSWREAT